MPLTSQQRHHNEFSIRAAMDRLLHGDLPGGRRCDLKSLAREAGVARSGFYPRTTGGRITPGPYQHLAGEFHRRLRDLQTCGQIPDPRDNQIARLSAEAADLRKRISDRDKSIAELVTFKKTALSQLAAQYDEIVRLRTPQLPARRPGANIIALVPRQ